MNCPECFSQMWPDGGCFTCPVCGYSACELTTAQLSPHDHFEDSVPFLADRD